MKLNLAAWILLTGLSVSLPAAAGLFSASCENASASPKPDWVSQPGYAIPNFYVGIGIAEKNRNGLDAQRRASENNAKHHLIEQIEVSVRAETEQSQQVNGKEVQEQAISRVMTSANEVLHDLKIKDRWVDKESCTVYTLMVVSVDSVAQSSPERLMKSRLEKMKTLLAEGGNREKNPDPKVRRKSLEEADLLFAGINFSLIDESYGSATYAKRIADGLAEVNREIADAQQRMAVLALNRDGKIPHVVLAKMRDSLQTGDARTDRLGTNCTTPDDCLLKARERGFGGLVLLTVEGKVEASNSGAVSGMLSANKTVYDIASGKAMAVPVAASARLIGWSNDDLNWGEAAETVMLQINRN